MGLVMKHTGACHCERVIFDVEVTGEPTPHWCNCSMCAMKGSIAFDVPLAALTVTTGQELLSRYQFNTGVAEHYFCSNCGIHLFQRLRSDPSKYGVNGACLQGVGRYDFVDLPVHDGSRSHPNDTGKPTRIAGIMRYEPADD